MSFAIGCFVGGVIVGINMLAIIFAILCSQQQNDDFVELHFDTTDEFLAYMDRLY